MANETTSNQLPATSNDLRRRGKMTKEEMREKAIQMMMKRFH